MDQQVAKLVVAVGGFIGLIFWLVALRLYRKMADAERLQHFESRLPDRQPAEAIRDLLSAGKELFSLGGALSVQPRVNRPADNQLIVDQSGILVRFEAVRAAGGSQLVAEVDDATYTGKYQIGFGAYVMILMPLVIGGLAVGMWHYVAASEAPAVRWQSLQVVQMVHVLWPPFLIYSLWKRGRTQVANSVANLLVLAQAGPPAARATWD